MRSAVRAAILAVLLPTCIVPALSAQQHRPGLVDVSGRSRHGFWGSLGFGAGNEAVDLVNPDDGLGYSDSRTAATVQIRLGGTVNPHLRLGGELSSWVYPHYTDSGDVTESLSGLFGIAQLYPGRRAGFYLKAGAGVGRSAVNYSGGPTISDMGFAAVLGAGWDIRVGRHLAITPTIDVQFQDYSGAEGGGYRERIGAIGIALTYQAGGL